VSETAQIELRRWTSVSPCETGAKSGSFISGLAARVSQPGAAPPLSPLTPDSAPSTPGGDAGTAGGEKTKTSEAGADTCPLFGPM